MARRGESAQRKKKMGATFGGRDLRRWRLGTDGGKGRRGGGVCFFASPLLPWNSPQTLSHRDRAEMLYHDCPVLIKLYQIYVSELRSAEVCHMQMRGLLSFHSAVWWDRIKTEHFWCFILLFSYISPNMSYNYKLFNFSYSPKWLFYSKICSW